MAYAPQSQDWPPKASDDWLDLEYSGCFYCERPWDHNIITADATIYLCVDCYERRYGSKDGPKPE
jgi:hypothetical protein